MSSTDQTSDTDELERAAESIEAPLASLVGDYEEADAHNAPRASGIFLLPNLFTSGALFCGFYAIIAGMQGDFYAGAVAILVAMIFDGLDGRVARMTRTSSAFGAQYESLRYGEFWFNARASRNWALTGLGKVGWVAALSMQPAGPRLARFNAHMESDTTFHRRRRPPLPRSLVWSGRPCGWDQRSIGYALLLTVLGFDDFPSYSSFKSITFDRRVPFVRMLLVVAVLGLIALDPPLAIWGMSVIYALSGPLQYLRSPDHSRREGAKDYDKADLH